MKTVPIQSLIVDDDRSVAQVLGELVSREHPLVHVFSDGQKAIAYLQENPADIVITDLMMPGVSGLEVLSLAKKANPDAIVIIITGHGTLETAIEAVRNGAHDYIRKPFKLEEMGIAFHNAVEKIQLVRRNKELVEKLKETCDELVAVKEACGGSESKVSERDEAKRTARVNFFSRNIPSIAYLHETNEDRHKLFERLGHISKLKVDGLLTEKEFKALKANIIKSLDMYTGFRLPPK